MDNKNYIYQFITDKVLMISLDEKYSFTNSGFENDDDNDQSMNIFYPILFFVSKIFLAAKKYKSIFLFFLFFPMENRKFKFYLEFFYRKKLSVIFFNF